MEQITRTLRPGGELITVDVVTRNGYRMWPETREVVHALWRTLPERFRLNGVVWRKGKYCTLRASRLSVRGNVQR